MEIPDDIGLSKPLRGLPPEERAARMLEAERLWDLDAFHRRWSELTEREQEFAARTMHLALADDDLRLPTYRCPKCCDTAHLSPSDASGVWFCDCRAGTMAEAGYWFRQLYIKRGRKVDVDRFQQERFSRYLRERSNGIQVRDAVNVLADKSEQEGE
jgi:hypothetical protein